ncbi:helix-turn-helix domain-containing protein [Bradyrhizobium sp. th.b2]|uniref:helix-turn-helix domain-containing protein n=1 Tax=Bradyrhizobium sp. th-b2 TaxID=172088 RepID=UPI0003FE0962|nr:helix-turn-helix transcriptional regulator [Bradyrhizobium sp. th.b2]
MSRTLRSTRQKKLIALIIEKRKAAGLTQSDVAKKLRRYQSIVANIESGERRIDVIEFLELAEAIGFDPGELIGALRR